MGDAGKLAQSLRSRELDLPPSCVECCPAHPSYFLVGTYCLQPAAPAGSSVEGADGRGDTQEQDDGHAQPKQPQSRNGSVIVFRVVDGAISHVQTERQPSALLDLHFNPHDGSRDICAVVSSTATLAVFRLSPGEGQPLKHLKTMDITAMSKGEIGRSAGEEILFLSFCWHPLLADAMAITTSTGHVHLVHLPSFDGQWDLHPEPIITHTLETWCVAISAAPGLPKQSNGLHKTAEAAFTVYSGGDDSTMRHRTCNWNRGSLAGSLPALESRGHDAGVTAILPLCKQEDGHDLVVTGSYDEHIRLFSVPPSGKAKKLAESRLGGGVWRLKLVDLVKTPQQEYGLQVRILASCMHAGARVVELVKTIDGEYQFRVLGRFQEHKSMNYGSDFRCGSKDQLVVVSTSFYDKLLCLWEFKLV